MQLLDSDWPANILAGSHFQAQETRALSPDGVCALARARLGTRLTCGEVISTNGRDDYTFVPSFTGESIPD